VLFAAFFLKQTCDKGHVNSETTPAETALVSRSITSATCVKSRLSITLAKILPPTDNSEIPRLLPRSTRSPLFLYIAKMLASFHCWGTRQVLQILQMKACRWTWRSFPPYFNTSAGRWSTPQALLDLRPVMADWTSVRVSVYSRQVMGGSEGSESRKESVRRILFV